MSSFFVAMIYSAENVAQWVCIAVLLLLVILHVTGSIGPSYVTEEALTKHGYLKAPAGGVGYATSTQFAELEALVNKQHPAPAVETPA